MCKSPGGSSSRSPTETFDLVCSRSAHRLPGHPIPTRQSRLVDPRAALALAVLILGPKGMQATWMVSTVVDSPINP